MIFEEQLIYKVGILIFVVCIRGMPDYIDFKILIYQLFIFTYYRNVTKI